MKHVYSDATGDYTIVRGRPAVVYTRKPRIIAYDIRRHMRLIANSKSYHVEAQGFNEFAKGMTWRSVQRAPLAIGDEAAVRMLHRQIITEAAEHQCIYSNMAESVRMKFARQALHGLAYGGNLVGSTLLKHYHRGAQRGRVTLPQPVTAGSNRGAKE